MEEVKERERAMQGSFRLLLLPETLCPESSGNGGGGKKVRGGRERRMGGECCVTLRCVATVSVSPAGGKSPILCEA